MRFEEELNEKEEELNRSSALLKQKEAEIERLRELLEQKGETHEK